MVDDGLRALRVNAVELLRQAGVFKEIDATVLASALDVEHDSLDGDIRIVVELESMNDGISVRGSVSAPWNGVCRRCLKSLGGKLNAAIDELYQLHVIDEEAYPIENNQLDLAPMARQTALLELDQERLCEAQCAGLCGICGIDRNVGSCTCDTTVKDDRWAALEGLRLDD